MKEKQTISHSLRIKNTSDYCLTFSNLIFFITSGTRKVKCPKCMFKGQTVGRKTLRGGLKISPKLNKQETELTCNLKSKERSRALSSGGLLSACDCFQKHLYHLVMEILGYFADIRNQLNKCLFYNTLSIWDISSYQKRENLQTKLYS